MLLLWLPPPGQTHIRLDQTYSFEQIAASDFHVVEETLDSTLNAAGLV